jgi:PAS domain S-box-containing protein
MVEGDIKTLIVDDSEFFAEMTAETLSTKHGIESVAVHSGTAAVEQLTRERFDCVVSDYEMPDMDGLELLSTIREEDPSLPFILLTGRGDEETASEAIAAGVADYLLKLEVVEDKQYGRLANRIESVVDQHRTRKKFKSLVENSPDGIAQVTDKGILLSVNPAMTERLDGDGDAVIGERLTDLMDEEIARDWIGAVRDALDKGEPVDTEDSIDGRYYENQFVPVENNQDRATVQLVSRDVTERVERERELRRQNERLEEFASVVSHDLRNPLNVAQSALELLDPGENDELLEKIDRSLGRMNEIIEDVLALAREGQAVNEPEPVDFEPLATEVWGTVETNDSDLSVVDDIKLNADPSRVQDLLANLFRNAVEHNDGPVTITVGAIDGDGFYVADDGDGISEELDVFEMGNTTADGGTGIGLAIVTQIADAHGWSVELTESDNGGARFELTGVEMQG